MGLAGGVDHVSLDMAFPGECHRPRDRVCQGNTIANVHDQANLHVHVSE